ncbi:HepT-like ribonuclease domain-containing protein [Pseudomonas kitaguniensis]|uniref:HepT-like ribonuclease domain-containing protein n=1 Tax=Pseudomonas kitaguniensis TaxID=2607908 RepID=UPI003D07CD3F
MTANRLADYLEHIRQAATDAIGFVEGLSKEEFLEDRRTQQAVVMSLVIMGEASTKIMDQHPDFTVVHAQVPWRSMRGMRNRIAHGYFDINLDVVWDTIQNALPDLLERLPGPPA